MEASSLFGLEFFKGKGYFPSQLTAGEAFFAVSG